MRIHATPDKEHAAKIRKRLAENDGYCPCVFASKGKEEYRCLCYDFRVNAKPGDTCHCGLYIKDE